MREYVAEQLSDNVLTICELVNKPQYLPKIPTRLEITSVYDTRFADCDPYLWRLESEYGWEILKFNFLKRGSVMFWLLEFIIFSQILLKN